MTVNSDNTISLLFLGLLMLSGLSVATLESSEMYNFKCLGHIEGPRWLDGRTADGTVGLAPSTGDPYTGTKWQAFEVDDGIYTFKCLGHIEGPRWLDGRTADGTVGLAPSTGDPYTGTKWQAFEASSAPTPTVSTLDLGTILYTEAPKTWTIDIPADFTKVEVGVYGKGEDTPNSYGGWNAYLKVNGDYAWEFLRYDSALGGIIQDHLQGAEVLESSGKDQYLEVTSMITPGENTITYYHYTSGDGIGIKVRIFS
jgi:hypothetical protein